VATGTLRLWAPCSAHREAIGTQADPGTLVGSSKRICRPDSPAPAQLACLSGSAVQIMDSTDIFVGGDDNGVRSVTVSPVVLLSVLDHHMRREAGSRRVIGTLLGRFTSDGGVAVTASFPLPHAEDDGGGDDDTVAVDTDYHKNMYELHRRVNPTEEQVGWYATGTETDRKSVIIHEFYGRECASPVHLLVDADLSHDRLDVNAFVSTAYKIGDLALSSEFRPVPVAVKPDKAGKVGLDVLFKNRRREEGDLTAPVMASEIDNLEKSLQRLLDLLDGVGKHVDAVVAGEVEGDVNAGRFLAETLTMVPKIEPSEFERLFGDNMRDLLMVAYLCKLTQSGLVVAEKLLSINL
jgi:translation initiation factor 3 subunit F